MLKWENCSVPYYVTEGVEPSYKQALLEPLAL